MPDASPATGEWTIARLLAWTTDHFARKAIPDARLAAEVLLAKALGSARIQLYTRMNDCPPAAALDVFRDWVKRAAAGEPIAYLVGEKEFFSLPFRVTPDVLIPRPETETLVECAIDHCAAASLAAPVIWDLCTGSGCVAIALLKQLPAAQVVASDLSPAALGVARGNAERHKVADRLKLVEADGLALPTDVVPPGGFPMLVCNPPYIAAESVAGLDKSIRDYEPRMALTDESDGLIFYRRLAEQAGVRLAPGGVVLVETADDRAEVVRGIFTTLPGWMHVNSVRDRITGKERVVIVKRINEPSR